jgi:predicted nucleic acid-binding protein
MPDRVISNTPPLFYLHRLRRLDLLQKLYRQIIVPEAVVAELKAGRA